MNKPKKEGKESKKIPTKGGDQSSVSFSISFNFTLEKLFFFSKKKKTRISKKTRILNWRIYKRKSRYSFLSVSEAT